MAIDHESSSLQNGCGGPEDDGRWPLWFIPLRRTRFFGLCKLRDGVHKSACNMYCLDCMDGALCSTCVSDHHCGHRTMQIRRASHHDAVRVAEIEKVLDVRDVQRYSINRDFVVFLNERPMDGPGKGAGNGCEVCERGLRDPLPSFCSLGCKFAAGFIRKNTLPKKEKKKRNRKTMETAAEHPPATSVSSFRMKRSKGVPRRAPLGTLELE